jgi:hypothetical protein
MVLRVRSGAEGARWAFLLLIGAAALLAAASSAFACTCMVGAPVCQTYWTAGAVFDATVERIDPTSRTEDMGGREVTFTEKIVHLKIRQAWKGVDADSIDVITAAQGGMCGYDFKPGKRYLVFAERRTADGRWAVSSCSQTHEFDGTGEDAAFLASLGTAPKGARVYGSIKTMQRRFDGGPTFAEDPVETKVRLLGDGQERVAMSTGGTFEFTGLAKGPYRLSVELPENSTLRSVGERTIELPDERACARADYNLAPSGRITGRVVDAAGRPPKRIFIEANIPDARGQPGSVSLPAGYPDEQGRFEIAELPPGRYIVGINLENRPPSQYAPYARTVYPSDGTDGTIVTIAHGETFDLGEWRLPPPVPTVRLDGVVVWEDGTPAAGVGVAAFDVTGNPDARGALTASTTSVQDGRFTIELRQGRVYTLALSGKAGRRLPSAPARVETSASPPAPIRLVIQGKPQ